MASRAPLVLAAALFVLGIAGLAQTLRQTSNGAPTPLSDLAIRPLAHSTSTTTGNNVAPLEAVSDVPAPFPSDRPAPAPTDAPTRQATAVFAAATREAPPVVTQQPTPAPNGGAIAVAVASDGDGTVPATATTTPLHPLRFGMVGRDADAETPASATIPESTATPTADANKSPDAETTPAESHSAAPATPAP